jgi:hypothetical protein
MRVDVVEALVEDHSERLGAEMEVDDRERIELGKALERKIGTLPKSEDATGECGVEYLLRNLEYRCLLFLVLLVYVVQDDNDLATVAPTEMSASE